jgi:alcohol/geraniol dehydrogenase (NADP+)
MVKISAWAAHGPKQELVPFEYEAGELGLDEVEIAVEHCGLCYSDLSILNDEWGISVFPCVPGHEVIGRVVALGKLAKGLTIGQRVGLGWTAATCMYCQQCLSGHQNRCPEGVPTIVERVRAQSHWTIPLPEGLDASSAGPLLCGGVTVFDPLYTYDVKPTQRVGVVGIGGLGHLAIKFAAAWGCEVTALTSSKNKFQEARAFGAHHVVSSQDTTALRALARSLDFLLVTVNVPLDWSALIETLAPQGRLHIVGAVIEPIPVQALDLIFLQRSISGSLTGAPTTIASMLRFAAQHHIVPEVEHFQMKEAGKALLRLASGKARYRIVLDADFAEQNAHGEHLEGLLVKS